MYLVLVGGANRVCPDLQPLSSWQDVNKNPRLTIILITRLAQWSTTYYRNKLVKQLHESSLMSSLAVSRTWAMHSYKFWEILINDCCIGFAVSPSCFLRIMVKFRLGEFA